MRPSGLWGFSPLSRFAAGALGFGVTLLLKITLLSTVGIFPVAHAAGAEGEWESGVGFRRRQFSAPPAGSPGFTLLPAGEIGIGFTNLLSEAKVGQFQNTMNGSGVAAADFDRDGWCDLFFCNKEGPSALFRNLGNGRFTNVTESAGVACAQQLSSGALFADLNGDGYPDLVVSSFGGPNAFLVNDGHGHFVDRTRESGLTNFTGSTSMAAADLDGDGDLDLYLCNFGMLSILRDGGQVSTRMVNGKPVVTGRYAGKVKIIDGLLTEYGEPDVLFWNDGDGHFTAAKWPETFFDEDGKAMSAPLDFGLAVQIRDIDGDGLPDIYVCNDFQTPDRLWLNQGNRKFRATDRMALRTMSYASMGVDFADLDRDGRLDFITVEMLSRDHAHHLRQTSPMRPLNRVPGVSSEREEVPRNAVYWNRGDGTFADIAYFSGLAATDWSWAAIFLDVDLDGYEDLLVSNGHMHDVNSRDLIEAARANGGQTPAQSKGALASYPKLESPKYAFRNRGDLTFEEKGRDWGFNSTWICHGMCLADLDNDGDLDVVLNAVNHPPLIYRNNSSAPRLAIRLKGEGRNGFGVGGKITVSGAGLPVQTQEMLSGGRYLSGDDMLRVFACGSAPSLRVEVAWSSGKRSVVEKASPNALYEIEEAKAEPASPASGEKVPAPAMTLMKEVTSQLGHQHTELPFDDFAVQPLLPHRLSQLGPGVSCADWNGDGLDDLIVASGQGGSLAMFAGDGNGRFTSVATTFTPLPDDAGSVLVLPGVSGSSTLWTTVAQYERPDPARGAASSWEFSGNPTVSGRAGAGLPAMPEGSSAGALCAADFDGDGDLDLFVGGRYVAGRYPEPPVSLIYRNNGGAWVLDAEASAAVRQVGMVSGALWTDLSGDGYPELVLACEWGPIRVFLNERGKLREVTRDWGLDGWIGWWNSVAAGDFDGDGKIDLVAGNWGLNGPEQVWSPLPRKLFYGDFADDKSVQMIESIQDPGTHQWMPAVDFSTLRNAIPSLRAKVANHETFAAMSVAQLLEGRTSGVQEMEVRTLTSLLLLNRGSRWEARPLPREAQWTPIFGISVADLDGDGAEDLFIAQNCFAVRPDQSRLDAGRGLWLRGDGRGGLEPVSGERSGVKIYGEQRGCAVGDFNQDGRVDLVVTENGGPTHLFLNQAGKPGLSVQLKGPSGNPTGYGAVVRLKFEQNWGPAHEIHAGSGYWSQDAAKCLLGFNSRPSAVWVRWPGGRETTVNLTDADFQHAITVRAPQP